MPLPVSKPHRHKKTIQEKGIKLWQLRMMLGDRYTEPKLSRFLNGIDPMPELLEGQIEEVVK